MKIEVGCGTNPTKEGFETCDIRDLPGVDYVCTAWELDKHVDENTVDHFYSRHFFEHLTFQQGEYVLEMWHRLLKPGGVCEIILPNMTFHIKQWIERPCTKILSQAKAGFWGWQNGEFEDTWPVHKSGYDEDTLSELLESKEYVNIESLEPRESRHLHIVCNKK